jgi:hypothetical protein
METCNDDIILAISSLLLPRDRANLALACKRFGMRSRLAPTSKPRRRRRRRGGEEEERYALPWSIMEEASRRQVSMAKNDTNDKWKDSDLITIRGEESWMAVHQRLHLLRTSLVFGRIIGNTMKYVDGDITRIWGRKTGDKVGHSVAICQRMMKAGTTHSVEFVVTEVGGNIGFGIMRPIYDYPHRTMKFDEFGAYCNARRRLNAPGYEGDVHRICEKMPHLNGGDVIRMVLDFDKGTLTVYRNGVCFCVIVRTGLAGNYCWAVTMDKLGFSRPSVRILSGSIYR